MTLDYQLIVEELQELFMKSDKKEKIAVFRFGVIFPLLENDVSEMWGEKERILREQVSKDWNIPYSNKSYMSKATILNWYKKYLDGGKKIEALYPAGRGDKGKNRTLDEETISALILFRNENPKISNSLGSILFSRDLNMFPVE